MSCLHASYLEGKKRKRKRERARERARERESGREGGREGGRRWGERASERTRERERDVAQRKRDAGRETEREGEKCELRSCEVRSLSLVLCARLALPLRFSVRASLSPIAHVTREREISKLAQGHRILFATACPVHFE